MERGDWKGVGGNAAALAMEPPEALGDPGSVEPPAPRSTPLVARVLAGDAGAFDEIVRHHERRVYGVARRLLTRPEDAEDAAQEAFLRLYRALGKLDPARPLAPYLYRITVNVCRDLGRRRRRPVAVPLDQVHAAEEPADPSAGPAEAARLAEERRIAAAALRALPERQRAALVLRDVQGLSTREVARVLGTTEVTVRTQISRARLKMKELRDRILEGKKETS